MERELLGYLERLLGERVDADDTISVSSTQRARIAAWLRDKGMPTDFARLGSNRVKVTELLNGGQSPDVTTESHKTESQSTSSHQRIADWPDTAIRGPIGLGIDIQSRESIPETNDFRSDNFFKSNFSAREIAHCIEQRDPLESFAGLWAAKEAIVKAGAASGDVKTGLRSIQITYDAAGAPTYPRCLISISHDRGIAVAVCVRMG